MRALGCLLLAELLLPFGNCFQLIARSTSRTLSRSVLQSSKSCRHATRTIVFALEGSELDAAVMSTEDEVAEWAETGRKGRVLLRKKDAPAPEYSPAQVCDKVLRALQLNDDPMLDYGAAVLVKFSSPENAASQLSPSAYGQYLRSSEFEVLLENSRFGLNGALKMAETGTRCVQTVTVVGPPPALSKTDFDFQLSKAERPGKGDCWMIDAVSLAQ